MKKVCLFLLAASIMFNNFVCADNIKLRWMSSTTDTGFILVHFTSGQAIQLDKNNSNYSIVDKLLISTVEYYFKPCPHDIEKILSYLFRVRMKYEPNIQIKQIISPTIKYGARKHIVNNEHVSNINFKKHNRISELTLEGNKTAVISLYLGEEYDDGVMILLDE